MAKKQNFSTSRADREDDRRRRNAPLRRRSVSDANEMSRQMKMRAGFYRDPADLRGFEGKLRKVVLDMAGAAIAGSIASLDPSYRRGSSMEKIFDKNKSRVSKVGRDRWNPTSLSKAAGGKPTQSQKRGTVARAEKARQTSAARSAGRKKASAAKRRER